MIINRTPKPASSKQEFPRRVQVKEIKDPNEALKQIRQYVSAKEVSGAFVAVKKLLE